MNRPLEMGICADVKATLRMMLEALGEQRWGPRPWLDRLRGLRAEWQAQLDNFATDRATPLHPAAFFTEFYRCLPEDVRISWDGGDFTHWGRAMTPSLGPGRWLRLGPLATIGSGLPNSLALKLANPDKPVVCITGDGSLGFYLAELDTAVRHNLPVVIIVGNDGGWGIERQFQQAAGYPGTVACELRRSRYDVVMQGLGGRGEVVEELDEIRPAMERAFSSGAPYLINVMVRGERSPFAAWQIAGKQKK